MSFDNNVERFWLVSEIEKNKISNIEFLESSFKRGNGSVGPYLSDIDPIEYSIDEDGIIGSQKPTLDSLVVDRDIIFGRSDVVDVTNCVFKKDVIVRGNKYGALRSVYFDNVVFMGRLLVSGEVLGSVSLYKTSCPFLVVNNVFCKEISVRSSTLYSLSVYCCSSRYFDVGSCSISKFETHGCCFKNVSFDHSQIDYNKQFSTTSNYRNGMSEAMRSHDFFSFGRSGFEQYEEEERRSCVKSTVDFLYNYTNISNDREALSRLRAMDVYYSTRKSVKGYVFSKFFGAFSKPGLFVQYYVVTIFLFATMYYFFTSDVLVNGAVSNITFLDSLYYSAASISSAGLGDVALPRHISVLTVIEGVIGVLLANSFIVALYRKMVEKD